MKLSFHGADREVTGSCHLLEAAGKRVLVDCGMYQGSRDMDADNAGDFGFDPASIDVDAWSRDPDTLVVPDAGEILFRLR